jgi:cytidylate kinase
MGNFIITIARQYGSGGREVGLKLSEKIGYKFYDKNLITLAAQKSGLSTDALSTVDEKAASSLLYTLAMGSSVYNQSIGPVTLPINDKLFVVQSELIKELSSTGDGIIVVGRCADYVLSERQNLVRIFITAPFDVRVKNIMNRHGLTEARAKDLIVKTDKRRSNYYSYYTGDKWGKSDKYDLIVSTDKIGTSGAAEMIANYIKLL